MDAPWVTLPKRVGLRIFGKFFALPTIIKHVSDFGFQIPPSSQPQSKELLPLIQIVLDTWRQLLSPSSLTYVIDASERMPIEVLERVKFQVNRAREHRVSPELTSVIGVNDEARILVTSKNDPTTATEAIANLTRSGTGILQGGVRVALDLYKSSPSLLSRSGIIIITTAAESQGTVVPSILDDMLLGENPVDVSVIKIAVDPAVDTISIKQLGLTSYYTVPLGSLETTMEKIRLSW